MGAVGGHTQDTRAPPWEVRPSTDRGLVLGWSWSVRQDTHHGCSGWEKGGRHTQLTRVRKTRSPGFEEEVSDTSVWNPEGMGLDEGVQHGPCPGKGALPKCPGHRAGPGADSL